MKIRYPSVLPQIGVSDAQFSFWKDKLEVYLETEQKFHKFLPGGRYQTWEPAERNEHRIVTHVAPDTAESLPEIRRHLRAFITTIAEYIHIDYYQPMARHSTSLKWIYDKIRQDYNLELQGIHFLNIIDVKYDPTGSEVPIGFYNRYRSLVIGNLKPSGTRINWLRQNLQEDEKLLPSHEDLILLNVLNLLHPKLPAYIRTNYAHKIGKDSTLMDFKNEILGKAKDFIEEIENPPLVAAAAAAVAAISTKTDDLIPECNYIPTPRQYRAPQRPPYQNFRHQPRYANNFQRFRSPRFPQQSTRYQQQSSSQSPYCRLCHLNGKPNFIYKGHYIGQKSCPSMSQNDKDRLASPQLNYVDVQDEDQNIMIENGYYMEESPDQEDILQVNAIPKTGNPDIPQCNFIQPVPAQILSVQDKNNMDVHLHLDSGANVSFIKLDAARAHGFNILPNNQLSNLADGKTLMSAFGEVEEYFFRNSFQVRF